MNPKSSLATQKLVLVAMSAAIIAVLSQLSINLGPIPFTLQTFGIGLLATLLQAKEAGASVLLYLLLGAIGLPVFAGGASGFQALLGPAAGFLWGFIIYALITGRLTKQNKPIWHIFLANLLGDSFVFLLGAFVYSLNLGVSLNDSFKAVVLPFIFADTIKMILISLIAPLIGRSLTTIPYFKK